MVTSTEKRYASAIIGAILYPLMISYPISIRVGRREKRRTRSKRGGWKNTILFTLNSHFVTKVIFWYPFPTNVLFSIVATRPSMSFSMWAKRRHLRCFIHLREFLFHCGNETCHSVCYKLLARPSSCTSIDSDIIDNCLLMREKLFHSWWKWS